MDKLSLKQFNLKCELGKLQHGKIGEDFWISIGGRFAPLPEMNDVHQDMMDLFTGAFNKTSLEVLGKEKKMK